MHLSMHTAFPAETSVLRGLMYPPVQPCSRVPHPVPLPPCLSRYAERLSTMGTPSP